VAALALASLALPGIAPAAPAEPAAPADFSAKERKAITAIVKRSMAAERLPGVNVGIWIPGRGTYVRSFGVADRKTGRKLRLADHVRIASITKTFTAEAILQLVDQGKLALDDVLETWVPGIPNGDRITVRNLLGMTSGIYDFTMDETFLADFAANPLMPFGLDDVIAIVERHEPEFAPGEKVSYCDTNYEFLGAIVEKVSGRPIGEVIRESILDPLELRQTSFPTTPAMPSPYAHGYYAGDDGKGRLRDYTRTNPDVAWAAGAMISTVPDLRTWVEALARGTLLTPATHAEQLEFGPIPNPGGPPIGYGLGIFQIGDFVGHNGAILGYSTVALHDPKTGATVVIAGNKATNFSGETLNLFFALAQRLFPEAVEPPARRAAG
jgi:D-alanyl-D-alanine carboxypeptidase